MALVLLAIVILLVVWGVAAMISMHMNNDSESKKQIKADRARVQERLSIAEKGLRTIANGAGNPVFEAQDALDKINRTYETKEL